LNIVVSITDLSKENTRWPSWSWSKEIDRKTFSEDVAPLFADWDPEVRQLIEVSPLSFPAIVRDVAGPDHRPGYRVGYT
jgi:hypothetical protein